MHRIDESGHSSNLFSKGNPATGVLATILGADWPNAVQEEICAVIEGAGIPLVKGTNTQLYAALQRLIGGPGITLPQFWTPDAQEPTVNDTQRNAIVFPAGSDAWAWCNFEPYRVDLDWCLKLDEAKPSSAVNAAFDFRAVYLVEAAGAANPVAKTRRANNTTYVQGTVVIPEITSLNGYYYEYTVAGTSGSAPPVYPTVPGNTVADGTATLTCRAGGCKALAHAFNPPNAAWQRFSLGHTDLTIPHGDLSTGCLVHLGFMRRGSADAHTGSLEIIKARAYPVGA